MTQEKTPEPVPPPSNRLLIVMPGVLLWLAVVCQYVYMVPSMERLFFEFRMKMPWLTEQVFKESRWAVPAITIVAFGVCIGLGRRSRWPWLFLLILLPLVIIVLVAVSISYPFLEVGGLSSGGGRK